MKRSWLKKKSKKQAAIDRSYKLLKDLYLREHPRCEVRVYGILEELAPFPGDDGHECGSQIRATIHHRMGRGKHTCEYEYFMTACQRHHEIIEAGKKQARKLGYILYK